MIIQTHKLDTQQLISFDALNAECKHIDGNVTASYRHLLGNDRGRLSNILYYNKQKLIGFLGAFFFHDKLCELSVMVAPHERRTGIGTEMLNRILPLIRQESIDALVFSSPKDLHAQWLLDIGFTYQSSEYQMQRNSNAPLLTTNVTKVRDAIDADIPFLHAINDACFPNIYNDAPTDFHKHLHDPAMRIFVATLEDNIPMGKAHVTCLANRARLTDIGVIPRAQGHGLGSALLNHCIHYAYAAHIPTIVLDVESANQHACNLYTRLGFTINNAHDYWRITEYGLTDFLRRL